MRNLTVKSCYTFSPKDINLIIRMSLIWKLQKILNAWQQSSKLESKKLWKLDRQTNAGELKFNNRSAVVEISLIFFSHSRRASINYVYKIKTKLVACRVSLKQFQFRSARGRAKLRLVEIYMKVFVFLLI